MPVLERGDIRITIGALSRADKLDLWVQYTQSDWFNNDEPQDNDVAWMRRLQDTDAMVAATATRKIEVCVKGKWQELERGKSHTITVDGESVNIQFPPTFDLINHLPGTLGDEWIEISHEKNGDINSNLSFFSSLRVVSGKTNSEPPSDEPPSSTPKTANSPTPTTGE